MNEDECIKEIERIGKGILNEEKKAIVRLAFAYGIMEGINKVEKIKMKTYNVKFILEYGLIKAEDEKQAREKAEEFFDNDCQDKDLFEINVEEIK